MLFSQGGEDIAVDDLRTIHKSQSRDGCLRLHPCSPPHPCLGQARHSQPQLHETRQGAPSGFSLIGSADPNQTLRLRLALVQGNAAELERKLYDVSTPSSSNYGKHLSKAEVQQLAAPAQGSVEAVNAWLKENDITAKTTSAASDWLSFEVPVSKANELFDADFSVFKHDNTGIEAVRTLSYSIPAELQGHLDLVHPTVTFPNPNGHLPVFQAPAKNTGSAQNFSARAVPSSCSNTITPACLQALYNIPSDEQRSRRTSSPLPASLSSTLTSVILRYASISVGEEYQDGDLSGLLDVINFLLAEDAPPNVITTSYGQGEKSISQKLAQNLCNAYAQLGARGVSILFTSGDGGVGGTEFGSCTQFAPTFPSGCPYMTSVGSTQGMPETAANFSTGGFSNLFSVPDYQSSAVKSYLSALGSTNQGLFNASGRGFPDVSTQGVNFEVVIDGTVSHATGTSASSPTFAAIVALLNDRLIAKGKSPLGFLNPFLYSTGASAFNDITTGSNPGCHTNGFPAKEGWDPVTGLGTPDFQKLASAVGL